MIETREWVKIVYSETPRKVNIKQGYLKEDGEFYEVEGDKTITLIRKSCVISISKKKEEKNDKK